MHWSGSDLELHSCSVYTRYREFHISENSLCHKGRRILLIKRKIIKYRQNLQCKKKKITKIYNLNLMKNKYSKSLLYLCVCECVCICVYIKIYTHTHAHTSIRTCTHTHTHVYILYLHTYTHTHVHVCIVPDAFCGLDGQRPTRS